jgi:hypothetical protein
MTSAFGARVLARATAARTHDDGRCQTASPGLHRSSSGSRPADGPGLQEETMSRLHARLRA